MAATIDESGIARMLTRARAHVSSQSPFVSRARVFGDRQASPPDPSTVPTALDRASAIFAVNRPLARINDAVVLAHTTRRSLTDLSFHLEGFRPLAGSVGPDWQLDLERHISEIQGITAQTRFRGERLFDGRKHSFSFDVGVSAGHRLELDVSVDVERSLVEHVTTGGGDISDGVHLGRDGLVIRVGSEAVTLYGSYASGAEFVRAINAAGIDGLTASLTHDGRLQLHSYRPIEIAGRGAVVIVNRP